MSSPFAGQEFVTPDVWGTPPICVRLVEPFDVVLSLNPELRIEQKANGEVVFMSPTGGETGIRNAKIILQIALWAQSHGGQVFDSSTLFQLPNGAKRSPDASWVSDSRWQQLSADDRKQFPPICPELVVELRSETDRLIDLQEKMVEYLENGARVGWLLDPLLKEVHVYRAGQAPERISSPPSVSAGELLPGLTLDLQPIWASNSN